MPKETHSQQGFDSVARANKHEQTHIVRRQQVASPHFFKQHATLASKLMFSAGKQQGGTQKQLSHHREREKLMTKHPTILQRV